MQKKPTGTDAAAGAETIEKSLRTYLVILVGCFLFEWGLPLVLLHGLHVKTPYGSPLWPWKERFHDFLDLVPRTLAFPSMDVFTRSDLGLPFQYPSPCIYVFLFLVRCFPNPTIAYLVSGVAFFVGAGAVFSWHLQKLRVSALMQKVVWATLLLGMPLGFLIDSGNIESFIWFVTMLGMLCFVKNWKYAAAMCFGVGGALKIYPLIFILLFLPRRWYKAAGFAVVVAGALYFAADAGFQAPLGEVLHAQKANGEFMRENQVLQISEGTIRYEHTLLSVYKQVVYWIYKFRHHFVHGPHIEFDRAVPTYTWLAGLGFTALYLGLIRKLPLMNQFLALTICVVLLPYISFEYTLVHLYTVFAALLLFLVQDVTSGRCLVRAVDLRRMIVCFAVLFSYLSALGLYRFGGQIKSLVLVGLLLLALKVPMPSTLFGDLPEGTAISPAMG